jgi:signal transduction histidine kinase
VTDRRSELVLALVPVVLTALTLVVLLDPRIPVATINLPLDVAINTVATLAAIAVAGLGWVHFRETREAAPLLRSSAFVTLACLNGLGVLVTAAGLASVFGLSLEQPGQLPVWGTVVSRGLASLTLLLAGIAGLRGWRADRWPGLLVVWVPTILALTVLTLVAGLPDLLPPLLGSTELALLRIDPTAPIVIFGARPLALIQVAIGLAYLGAAALSYRTFRRDGHHLDAFLAAGLTVAAFSQVQAAIHPGIYEGLVTLGDLERVLFDGILFVALVAESRDDVRALRSAYAKLSVLRDAELARATAEERARLAREIHDGMSQELWYAKLKQARLVGLDLSAEARALAAEVAGALESALSEARQAILALRPAESGSFSQVLCRYVSDFSDRFGIRAECECDPLVDMLPTRAQAELLRIAQEALTNAHRHADATLVRVVLTVADRMARLTVSDNGLGFEPQVEFDSGYGLSSMRERADVIGGRIMVDSGKQDGTRVTVEVPMELVV